MNLSEHFTREELSITHQPFANVPGAAETRALTILCEKVLEPVRRHFGRTTINSGYRSPKVNAAVGSKPGSQHMLGEAADIEVPGVPNATLAAWIRDNLAFDQLILEAYHAGDPSSGWVHVSYRTGRLRRSVLTMTMASHGPVYSNGITA